MSNAPRSNAPMSNGPRSRTDREAGARPGPALSASVRRHLGKSLRSFYAAALAAPMSEPMSERLEALLARLDKPRRP